MKADRRDRSVRADLDRCVPLRHVDHEVVPDPRRHSLAVGLHLERAGRVVEGMRALCERHGVDGSHGAISVTSSTRPSSRRSASMTAVRWHCAGSASTHISAQRRSAIRPASSCEGVALLAQQVALEERPSLRDGTAAVELASRLRVPEGAHVHVLDPLRRERGGERRLREAPAPRAGERTDVDQPLDLRRTQPRCHLGVEREGRVAHGGERAAVSHGSQTVTLNVTGRHAAPRGARTFADPREHRFRGRVPSVGAWPCPGDAPTV